MEGWTACQDWLFRKQGKQQYHGLVTLRTIRKGRRAGSNTSWQNPLGKKKKIKARIKDFRSLTPRQDFITVFTQILFRTVSFLRYIGSHGIAKHYVFLKIDAISISWISSFNIWQLSFKFSFSFPKHKACFRMQNGCFCYTARLLNLNYIKTDTTGLISMWIKATILLYS